MSGRPPQQPKYRLVAAGVRALLATLNDGELIPSAQRLAAEYSVDISVVRRALEVLRDEGLIITEQGLGSIKRPRLPMTVIPLAAGDVAQARAATEEERQRLEIPPGVPVLVVDRRSGEREVYPGDRTMVSGHDPS